MKKKVFHSSLHWKDLGTKTNPAICTTSTQTVVSKYNFLLIGTGVSKEMDDSRSGVGNIWVT